MTDETGKINTELAELRGFIKGKLPLLATRNDIETIVNCALDRHVQMLHYNKKKNSMNSIPPYKNDKKLIVALVGIITVLATILSKIVEFFFSNHP